MDPLRILVAQNGFFTRAEARDLGYDDRSVAALVRGRKWHRIRRGFFTYVSHWTGLDEVGKHLLTAHTVLRSLGPAVALSHVTAAVAHGISVWGLPLDHIHVTRLDGGTGRVEAGVVHHEGRAPEEDVVEAGGHRVMSPPRATLETATIADAEQAFCLFESALHLGLTDQGELGSRFDAMKTWPGTRHLHVPIRMATGGSESVGEARGHWMCWAHHLPAPEPQFEVRDSSGLLLGTCDWGWPGHGLLGEFDGRVKYGRLLKAGQEAGDVVFAEKQREDLMREATGYAMFRATWTDYDRPRVTVARLSRLLGL